MPSPMTMIANSKQKNFVGLQQDVSQRQKRWIPRSNSHGRDWQHLANGKVTSVQGGRQWDKIKKSKKVPKAPAARDANWTQGLGNAHATSTQSRKDRWRKCGRWNDLERGARGDCRVMAVVGGETPTNKFQITLDSAAGGWPAVWMMCQCSRCSQVSNFAPQTVTSWKTQRWQM